MSEELSSSNTIVFCHIPKTGGTALSHRISSHFPQEQVAYYDVEQDQLYFRPPSPRVNILRKQARKVRATIERVFGPQFVRLLHEAAPQWHRETIKEQDLKTFRIVLGHFGRWKYDIPNARYITLIRDPLERAISHYRYARDLANLGTHYSHPGQIDTFIMSDLGPNFQSRSLGVEDLSSFTQVATTEGMGFLARTLGMSDDIPTVNRSEYPLSPDEIVRVNTISTAFIDQNSIDYALYEEACSRQL